MSNRWRKSLLKPPTHLRGATPDFLAPYDPWAGDEIEMQPGSYENYTRFSAASHTLSEAEYDEADAAFRRLYREILDGTAPWGSEAEVVAALAVDAPIRHDSRPPNEALQYISDDILAEMSEDQVPDIGVVAPDRVLGPLSEHALPRYIHRIAGAVMGFAPMIRGGVMPVARVIYQKPRPPTALSSPIRSIARAPVMVWHKTAEGLAPLLPLGPRQAGLFCGTRPRLHVALPEGAVVIGRATPLLDGGWWLAAALSLPEPPPPEILLRRMMLELHRLRRHDRRLSWEDLLRERAEVVYRTACEWSWLECCAETLALWRTGPVR
ncbi:MAG: hypothetical protein P8R54_07855 [Myxococcota bacterium]|nr:hypothetical protein [Myxococcota bacterium]